MTAASTQANGNATAAQTNLDAQFTAQTALLDATTAADATLNGAIVTAGQAWLGSEKGTSYFPVFPDCKSRMSPFPIFVPFSDLTCLW
jgi:hypothetical protein